MGEVLAAILRGEYQVGGSLPREVDLAAQHDVSRYVARECIQALRDRGVLTVKHGRGTTIAPPAQWNLFDATLLGALLNGRERQAVRADAAEMLSILWPEAAALAAERRTPDDLDRLERAMLEGEANFLQQLALTASNRFMAHALVAIDVAVLDGTCAVRLEEVLDGVRDGDGGAARAAMRGFVTVPD
jgi:GntR family transcriptional repressor for pyruvate dehydrogenase complex